MCMVVSPNPPSAVHGFGQGVMVLKVDPLNKPRVEGWGASPKSRGKGLEVEAAKASAAQKNPWFDWAFD